jgi:hypothetical protein
MTAPRHSWSAPARFRRKTERVCARCGLVRVTRHDGGDTVIPWVEFWREGVRLEARATPACEPEKAERA